MCPSLLTNFLAYFTDTSGEPFRSAASSFGQRSHLRLEFQRLRPTRERHGQVLRLSYRLAPHVLQELHGAARRLEN